jgi:hypothetical protein
MAFRDQLEAAGAEVVVEEGVLRAEVLGLEVARVVPGPAGEPVLQVGVGRFDRDARALFGPDVQPDQSLAKVIGIVRSLRTADAPVHPANQLAPERWLRSVVIAEPTLVGVDGLVPVPAPVPRPDLKQRAPAPATGTDAHGRPIVVVCSVGVDPALVPSAADARMAAAVASGADAGHIGLMLVVPDGDDYDVTRTLAGMLRHPAEVVTVPADWRRRSPA